MNPPAGYVLVGAGSALLRDIGHRLGTWPGVAASKTVCGCAE